MSFLHVFCIQYIVIIFYMYIKHYAWYTIIIDVKKNYSSHFL